ncbi:uncharacterized protein METZ01_LOCUS517386, partial [marine metagenome]
MPLDKELVGRSGEIESSTILVYGTRESIVLIETCRILKEKIPRVFLHYVY